MTAKDILDILSGAGTLGFCALAVWAFFTEQIVPRARLEEQRAEKREAQELAKQTITSLDRLSDAVEARNRLEAERLEWDRRQEEINRAVADARAEDKGRRGK